MGFICFNPILKYLFYESLIKVLKQDVTSSLEVTENVLKEGKDLNNLLWETIKYTKDVLLYK